MSVEHVRCNLCGQDAFRPVFIDTRTGFSQGFCRACGLIYVNPRMDSRSRTEFYETYGQKYPESFLVDPANPYRQIAAKRAAFFDGLFQILDPCPQSFLEVGCSYGFFLEELEKKGLQIEVYGLDPSFREVEYARRVNNLKHVRTGFVEELEHEEARFDVIALFHVLEHLGDPMGTLRIIHGALRQGGIVWIEVPDARRLKGDVIEYQHFISCQHLYEFSPITLKRLLERAGFEEVMHQDAPLGFFLESNQRAIYKKRPNSRANAVRDADSERYLATFRDRILGVKRSVESWLDRQMIAGKPIFIYGAGFHTMGLLGLLEFPKKLTQAFHGIIDDDQEKHGTNLDGLRIFPPSVLDAYQDAAIIVSTLVGEERIAGRLMRQRKPGWDIKTIYKDVTV